MKAFLLLLSCFVWANLNAQQLEYGNFIEKDTAIKWAAECDKIMNLTAKTPKGSIRTRLLDKLKKGNLTIYTVDADRQTATPKQAIWANIKQYEEPVNLTEHELHTMKGRTDEMVYPNLSVPSNCLCDTCGFKSHIDMFKVKQLVYYKNAHFYISNVLMAPLCYEKTDSTLEWKSLFNVALDTNTEEDKNLKEFHFIQNVNIEYKFDYVNEKICVGCKILTNRSPKIIFRLLEDAENNKITFYKVSTQKKVVNNDFLFGGYDTSERYNLKGSVINREVRTKLISPDSIYIFKINQDVFYNPIIEKVISKIRYVSLYIPRYSSFGTLIGEEETVRIYYVKPFSEQASLAERFWEKSSRIEIIPPKKKAKRN